MAQSGNRLVDRQRFNHALRVRAEHPLVLSFANQLTCTAALPDADLGNVILIDIANAAVAKLPIIIHCRPSEGSDDAWDDCLGLIREQWTPHGLGGILHCFTGTWAQAKRALDMGFMISLAGNVTFPKAQQIRDAALEVPLDRMLIETDSPYLAPVPYRGKRNEPAFVTETARKLGELRRISIEDVGEQTSSNFYNFFKLAEMAESKVPARQASKF